MPIVGDAKKVKKSMEKQYGKKEGERVFYATANKEGRTPETWKKKASVATLTAILRSRK
jgi:sarcosine oxidase delta subunit